MRRLLSWCWLPLAVAGCATSAVDSAQPPVEGAVPNSVVEASARPLSTLQAWHWHLRDARDRAGTPVTSLLGGSAEAVQLDFADGRVQLSNACNHISAGFSLEADRIQIAQLVSTQMACVDPALAAREQAIGTRLPGTHMLVLADAGDAPRLVLSLAGGDVLTFSGTPTAATRFGSEGEQMFLEVAPEQMDCHHPLMPEARCLQVREVKFDANGVRVAGASDWTPLYQQIEGFNHQPGVRNVLRVRRFELQDVPADASAQAYVLDMVVESEQVRP